MKFTIAIIPVGIISLSFGEVGGVSIVSIVFQNLIGQYNL